MPHNYIVKVNLKHNNILTENHHCFKDVILLVSPLNLISYHKTVSIVSVF